MFLRHVFRPAGDEFQKTKRGFSLERAYIKNLFSYFTQLLYFENYKCHFEAYFA
jgi:hypothetical protein